MNRKSGKPDWSEPCWREMLVYQRKAAWFDDTLDKLAAWMGLRPGMTAVDVGCGLGYLGYTYWPYFGKGGHYIGVDISEKLSRDASAAASDWAVDGSASFVVGDAYHLPLPDNSADGVMCQVIMMHLEDPGEALAEMVRVAKPGGLIMCKEPDNMGPALTIPFSSVPELPIDDILLAHKVTIISNRGRIKRGLGDSSIGPKIPHMLTQLGLTDIDIRLNDKVHYLEPPYEGFLQQTRVEFLKKQFFNEERRQVLTEHQRDDFLAGGGEAEEFERYRSIVEPVLETFMRQLERGEYYICSAGHFFVIKGRKPE